MLEGATLDVLARAAEIGLPELAEIPASAHDPLLRPFIRRRVRRAIDVASAATTCTRGDHVLRLAFVRAHPGAPAGLDPNDVRSVEQAFETLARPLLPPRALRPLDSGAGAYRSAPAERRDESLEAAPQPNRRPWPVTRSLVAFVVASVLVTAGVLIAPYALPSPLQRFARTPFGKILGEPLTECVVASRVSEKPPRTEAARAAMLPKDVEKQIGPGAFEELTALVDALPDAARSNADTTDDALQSVFARVNALNAKLLERGVPALLHAYANGTAGRRAVWLTSYFVEHRSDLDIGGLRIRIARGRRLDGLNLLDSTLYKATYEDWAVLSLDRIDEQLVERLLTPLAKGTPMGPEVWRDDDHSPHAELARASGRLVTAELVALAKLGPEDANDLRSAIEHRNDAMAQLHKMGWNVEATSRVRLPPALVRTLENAPKTSFEKRLVDGILRTDARMKVYAKPLAPIVAELARLEEEHFVGRLFEEKRDAARRGAAEAARGPGPGPAPPLETAPPQEDADERPAVPGGRRARAISASMLASLTRRQVAPRLALWWMVRAATHHDTSWEERVALAASLDALFEKLGLTKRAERLRGDAFATAARAALEAPPERTQAAARDAYEQLFGSAPPPVTRAAAR